jgi:hypothetical protein
MESVSSIINTVLFALAVAIGIFGIIMYFIELELFNTDTAILTLFIAVFFVAIAGLNSVDKD